MTFQFQQVIKEYLVGKQKSPLVGKLKYQTIAEVFGALVGAGLDFWDRIARDHEHAKRQENGDVW